MNEWTTKMNKRYKYSLDDYSSSQIEHCIYEWIHNSTHREILKRAFIDGETNEFIAEEFGYSVNGIKHIIKLSIPRLREHIDE